MNKKRVETMTEFQAQEQTQEFGDFITATEESLPQIRKEAMKLLAESIIHGVDICGYKSLTPVWIEKVPGMNSSAFDQYPTLGGKVTAQLTASNEQYNHYLYYFAKATLDDYFREVKEREKLMTLKGFLKFQISRLKKWWKKNER